MNNSTEFSGFCYFTVYHSFTLMSTLAEEFSVINNALYQRVSTNLSKAAIPSGVRL